MENNNQHPSAKNGRRRNGHAPPHTAITHEAAFGYPRDFLHNQFVYFAISPRANGLAIGVNLNPVAKCNFNCRYCEVDHTQPARAPHLEVHRLAVELGETLELARGGWLRQWPRYAKLPAELLQVRHVALSGDGEPTLAGNFVEAVQTVTRVRTEHGFFKIVLVTNSTALDQPRVQEGLKLFHPEDEVWAKLDGGTQDYLNRVNGPTASLGKILDNILLVGRQRPVVIQSLFPAIHDQVPPAREIKAYAQRLKELKQAGAQISLVQIYSATRPMAALGCTHLPLAKLSEIAQTVRRTAGLQAEVF